MLTVHVLTACKLRSNAEQVTRSHERPLTVQYSDTTQHQVYNVTALQGQQICVMTIVLPPLLVQLCAVFAYLLWQQQD